MNSERFRHTESAVYAPATRSGSRVFHAASAASTFCRAEASSNGGTGGRIGLVMRGGSKGYENVCSQCMRTIILLSSGETSECFG